MLATASPLPKFEKGVFSSPKARGTEFTEIMGNGKGLHPTLSEGLGISKKPKTVLNECLSDTTGGVYGPPTQHFKGTKIKSYYPLSTSKSFGTGIDHPLSSDPHFSLENSTFAFFKELHHFDNISIKYRDGDTSDFGHHADVQQVHNDIPFRNVQASITFNFCNKVIAYGSSLTKLDPANVAPSKPKISLEEAFKTAEDLLDSQAVKRVDTDDPKKYLVYLAGEGGSAILAYRFIVKNRPESILFEALVDAQSGQLVWVKDLVLHASVGL